jgi:predicted TIM-barrel fold metal-dependent hydrolase
MPNRRQFIKTLGAGTSLVAMTPRFGLANLAPAQGRELPEPLRMFKPIRVMDSHFHLHARLDERKYIQNIPAIMEACANDTITILSSTATAKLNENMLAALAKQKHPGRVYAFAGLHHHIPAMPSGTLDFAKQAERMIAFGFDGYKMIEGKNLYREQHGYPLDDPRYDGYFALMQERGLPISYHVADPWEGDTPPEEMASLYREVDGFLKKFPKLNVIFVHFFFMANVLDQASQFLDLWPQVSFDLTPHGAMYDHFSRNPDKARDFFIKYQDRIIYGTDNHSEPRDFAPGAPMEYWPAYKTIAMRRFLETDDEFKGWHRTLRGIKLDVPVLEKIYHKNYLRYVDKKPRPLDIGKIVEECERILGLAHKYAIVHDILPEVEFFRKEIQS